MHCHTNFYYYRLKGAIWPTIRYRVIHTVVGHTAAFWCKFDIHYLIHVAYLPSSWLKVTHPIQGWAGEILWSFYNWNWPRPVHIPYHSMCTTESWRSREGAVQSPVAPATVDIWLILPTSFNTATLLQTLFRYPEDKHICHYRSEQSYLQSQAMVTVLLSHVWKTNSQELLSMLGSLGHFNSMHNFVRKQVQLLRLWRCSFSCIHTCLSRSTQQNLSINTLLHFPTKWMPRLWGR